MGSCRLKINAVGIAPTAPLDTEAFNALILEDDADRDSPNRDDLDRDSLDRDGLFRDGLDRDESDRGDLDQPAPWKDARFTHEPWEWRGAEPEPEPEPERRNRLSVLFN